MNMYIDREISLANLNANEWNLNYHNHSTPFDSHAVYIVDYRIGSVFLFTLNINEFNNRKYPSFNHSEIVTELAEVLGQITIGTAHKNEALATLLTLYLKGTRTYQLWLSTPRTTDRFHALLNIFKGGQSSTIRPCFLESETVHVPSQQIQSLSKRIMMADHKNHPEWFR